MFLFRAMSKKEYENWRLSGVRGLFIKDGKTKRMVWFAIDPSYISELLVRPMYMNRKVEDAYDYVVMFGFRLRSEIPVQFKPENGHVNLGIRSKYMDVIELREVYKWTREEWLERYGFYVEPRMYYWNRKDTVRKAFSDKEVKNIIRNGNLLERPWFIRADVYSKLRNFLFKRYKNFDTKIVIEGGKQ